MNRETLLKQLQFRSRHRGINEMDRILGAFADAGLAGLTDAQLADYQRLLDAPDWDAFAWVTGKAAAPDDMAELVGLIGKDIAD